MMTAELLAPAGSMAKLKTVLRYGADAVYLGGKAFNLRAGSQNFSKESLAEGIRYAHQLGKKVYVTLNIIAHNRDVKALPTFIKHLERCGADAVIVADIGILDLVREHSNLPIHISTQASTASWRTAKMYHQLGAKRVVLARELSIDEIKKIKDKVPDLELEVFVHGAMCMTYSGRCNMSSYMIQRDSNHGMCANSCRWKYAVVEETRPGEYFPVYEDDTGSYMFNSKDLCTIEFIDQILAAGVDGLKIEGRGRGLLYGATTTKVYHEALKLWQRGCYQYDPRWLEELQTYNHRGYTTGFFHGQLDRKSQNLGSETQGDYRLAGIVQKVLSPGSYLIDVKHPFQENLVLESVRPNADSQRAMIHQLEDQDLGPCDRVPPNKIAKVNLDMPLEEGDIVRINAPVGR